MDLFKKNLGDPLSKSIFLNSVGLSYGRDHMIIKTNLTQNFCLANFKNNFPCPARNDFFTKTCKMVHL